MLTKNSFLQRVETCKKPLAGTFKKMRHTSVAFAVGSTMFVSSVLAADIYVGSQDVLAAETNLEAVTTEEAEIQIALTDLREDGRLLVGNTLAENAVLAQQMEAESREEFTRWAEEKQEEADKKAEERQKELEKENRRKNAVVSYSDDDYKVLLRIVQAEAGICDEKGKILVANVILNRVRSDRFPNSIKQVVFAPRQFSPVSDGSYNRVKVTEETIDCVNRALAGEDYSDGALFFMNRRRSKGSNVSWFDSRLEYLFAHGNHEFFR